MIPSAFPKEMNKWLLESNAFCNAEVRSIFGVNAETLP